MQTLSAIRTYLGQLTSYRDFNGLLVNKSGDGGDCAHNFGIYYPVLDYLGSLTEFTTAPHLEFNTDLYKISSKNTELGIWTGQYVRHSDTSKWYSKLKHMSRDQLSMLLNAMSYFQQNAKIIEVYHELKSRNFFHWNTEESDPVGKVKIADPIGISEIRLFINHVPSLSWLKFLRPLLDLDLVYAVYVNRWDSDIKLFPQFLVIEKNKTETFVSKWAATKFKKKTGVADKLRDAYVVHSLKIPPLGHIIREAYLKWQKS